MASRLLNLVPTSDTDPGADHYRQSANQALTVFVSTLKACKLRYNFTDLPILLQSCGKLREVSPEFADIVMQNTWSKALFRFGGNDSAEAPAEIVGKVRRYQ